MINNMMKLKNYLINEIKELYNFKLLVLKQKYNRIYAIIVVIKQA